MPSYFTTLNFLSCSKLLNANRSESIITVTQLRKSNSLAVIFSNLQCSPLYTCRRPNQSVKHVLRGLKQRSATRLLVSFSMSSYVSILMPTSKFMRRVATSRFATSTVSSSSRVYKRESAARLSSYTIFSLRRMELQSSSSP